MDEEEEDEDFIYWGKEKDVFMLMVKILSFGEDKEKSPSVRIQNGCQ